MVKFATFILIFSSFGFSFTQKFDVSKSIEATLQATDSGTFFVSVNGKKKKLSKMDVENFKEFSKNALFLINDFNGDGYKDFAIPSRDAYPGVNSKKDYYLFDPKTKSFKLSGKNIGYLKREGKNLIAYEKDGPFIYEIYYTIKDGKLKKQKSVVDFGIVKRVKEAKRVYFLPEYLTIKSKRAYFYNTPDEKSKTKIYVIKGDRVKVLDIKPFRGFLKIEYPSKKKYLRSG